MVKSNVPKVSKRMSLTLILSLVISLIVVPAVGASSTHVHPFDFPQTEAYPDEIFMVVEIPQGSQIKYEIDAENGHVFVDRYQSMSVQYPGNYGSIPQTLGEDGDPLDGLVLTRESLEPGTVIKIRPIGTLKMIDGGEVDDKIVAVPASDIDPFYDEVQTIEDLPSIELERIEQFFEVYKNLPEGSDVVELNGYDDVDVTKDLIETAVDTYLEANPEQIEVSYVNPFHYPQSENAPEEIVALIEIPAGSFTKYEVDADTGHVIADRFTSMPVVYPGNYGSMPQTLAGDGDPLDVIVLSREPIAPGTFINVRPIGTLKMMDDGEEDDKILAVPTSAVDPTYDDVEDLDDLPEIEIARIEEYFEVYKNLPQPGGDVELNGYTDVDETMLTIQAAVDAYVAEDNPIEFEWTHPFAYSQEDSTSEEFKAVIEIPTGAITKYEIDEDTGHVFADRFQSMSVHYPTNYGSIPQSLGGDGDPLDVLVLTRQPLQPGTVIDVRAIGILQMLDGGEVDDKIVAVPVSAIDPTYDEIMTIEDLPSMQLQSIEEFFAVYKNLPEQGEVIELQGYAGLEEAMTEVDNALENYRESVSVTQ